MQKNDNQCENKITNKATSLTISANGVTGELVIDHVKDGTDVSFNSAIVGSCNNPKYNWNFGDGESSQEANPIHKFEHSGEYNVELSVKCESCDPISATYRVALKCKLTGDVMGNCLAVFGQSEKYVIKSNDTTKTEWKGGRDTNPNTETGDEYNVVFQRNSLSPKDSYTSKVDAFCSADSGNVSSLDVKAAPACSEFEPLTLTSTVANTSLPPSGVWGLFTADMERNLPVLKECINISTTRLENRVPEIIHEYDLQIYPLSHPNAISSANDSKITNSNCLRVLRDLTPTQVGSPYPFPSAPMSRYWAAPIVHAHENFHNTDFISVVADPLKIALEQETKQLQSSMCIHNISYLNQIINFYEQKNRRLSLQWLGGSANGVAHEQRAYAIENPQLIRLTNAIRIRARNSGWKLSCQ